MKINLIGIFLVAFLLVLGSCTKEDLHSLDDVDGFTTKGHETFSTIVDDSDNKDPDDKYDDLITDDEDDDEDEDEANDR